MFFQITDGRLRYYVHDTQKNVSHAFWNVWLLIFCYKNSELRNLFIQPLDYRFSTKHKSNNYNVQNWGLGDICKDKKKSRWHKAASSWYCVDILVRLKLICLHKLKPPLIVFNVIPKPLKKYFACYSERIYGNQPHKKMEPNGNKNCFCQKLILNLYFSCLTHFFWKKNIYPTPTPYTQYWLVAAY